MQDNRPISMFDFKTLGTRLSRHEADLIENYCKRKGITASKLIKELLLKEIDISIPNNLAGKNIIEYDKKRDSFSWSVLLDGNQKIEVISSVSPEYLENLFNVLKEGAEQRNVIINKKKQGSVAVPTKIINGK